MIDALLGLDAVGQVELLLAALVRGTLVAGIVAASGVLLGRGAPEQRHLLTTAALLLTVLSLPAGSLLPALSLELRTPQALAHVDNAVVMTGWRADLAIAFGRADAFVGKSGARGPGILAWLGVIWLTGSLVLALRLGLGSLGLNRLLRASRPVTDRRRAALDSLGHDAGRTPALVESDDASTPFTVGWWHPVIVLPSLSVLWTAQRLEAVLRHEVAHVRRHDWPAQMLGRIGCVLFWFHPAVWWLARRQELEADRTADRAALSDRVPGPAYAEHLLALATRRGAVLEAGIPFAHRAGVEQRIREVLSPPAPRLPGRSVAIVAFPALLSTLFFSTLLAGCR